MAFFYLYITFASIFAKKQLIIKDYHDFLCRDVLQYVLTQKLQIKMYHKNRDEVYS